MNTFGEMCPDCGRYVQFLNRDTLRCATCPDPDERPLRSVPGGAHDCPEAIDFSHRNLRVLGPEASA